MMLSYITQHQHRGWMVRKQRFASSPPTPGSLSTLSSPWNNPLKCVFAIRLITLLFKCSRNDEFMRAPATYSELINLINNYFQAMLLNFDVCFLMAIKRLITRKISFILFRLISGEIIIRKRKKVLWSMAEFKSSAD